MTDFARIEAANAEYVATGTHRDLPARPARRLAVVTCMDARIDVHAVLGLDHGDVHVVRTAGGRVTDDVLRSLTLSTHALGVHQVAVVTHTDCGLHDPEGSLPDRLADLLGTAPDPDAWHAFADPAQAARTDGELLLRWPHRPDDLVVAAYVLDVGTGALTTVLPATEAEPRG